MAGGGPRLYNQAMRRRDWRIAVALSLAAASIGVVPYLLAGRVVGGEGVFAGFLLNPIDGFSYLAKMRQGTAGSWLFHLPYAAEPGSGAFLFTYYLFLGHLARWLGLPLVVVFHGARVFGSVAMYLASFWLYSRLLSEPRACWLAFAWTLVGSGLGWAAVPFERMAADLWVPELIPSLSAYASAHFPLAAAAYAVAVLSLLPGRRVVVRWALAAGSGSILSVLQPFSVVVVVVVAASWLLWEAARSAGGVEDGRWRRAVEWLSPLLAFSLGALPQMTYDAWVFRTFPALAAWSAQNQTPSPPLIDYVLGLGLVGMLAVAGVLNGQTHQTREGRLLIAWAVVQGLLLYAPVGVQRRLALGWSFSLAALAGMTLTTSLRSRRALAVAFGAVIGLSLPTNLLVASAGVAAVAAGDPALVLSRGEIAAYEWLSENAEGLPLVLASPETGTRLPAFAEVRVLYGHPFETPSAEEQKALVESLFRSDVDGADALRALEEHRVVWVFYGPREQALGRPGWLRALDCVYHSRGVEIYKVPSG